MRASGRWRPLFGGAGTDISRNNAGDLHGRDADMILGDNGNIYRVIGTTGFNYDNNYDQQIVVRATSSLDYTPGGPDLRRPPSRRRSTSPSIR